MDRAGGVCESSRPPNSAMAAAATNRHARGHGARPTAQAHRHCVGLRAAILRPRARASCLDVVYSNHNTLGISVVSLSMSISQNLLKFNRIFFINFKAEHDKLHVLLTHWMPI